MNCKKNKRLTINWIAITTYCQNNWISYWKVKTKLKNWLTLEEALIDSELNISRIKVDIPKEKKFRTLTDVLPKYF